MNATNLNSLGVVPDAVVWLGYRFDLEDRCTSELQAVFPLGHELPRRTPGYRAFT